MSATINYGNGNHDLSGDYQLVPDGGQWFVMGKNMSVPCGSLDQAQEVLDRLTGNKDNFKKSGAGEFCLFPK